MAKIIEQKGNFDSSILNGFREVSLVLGNKARTWKTEHVGHEMSSDWVNPNKENRLSLQLFQRETSKSQKQTRCERYWRKWNPEII